MWRRGEILETAKLRNKERNRQKLREEGKKWKQMS